MEEEEAPAAACVPAPAPGPSPTVELASCGCPADQVADGFHRLKCRECPFYEDEEASQDAIQHLDDGLEVAGAEAVGNPPGMVVTNRRASRGHRVPCDCGGLIFLHTWRGVVRIGSTDTRWFCRYRCSKCTSLFWAPEVKRMKAEWLRLAEEDGVDP